MGCGVQSHYIEFVHGPIFMEKNVIFGLILGWLEILKQKLADYEQLLMAVFSCFQGKKIFKMFFKNIVASALKSCPIPFLYIFF